MEGAREPQVFEAQDKGEWIDSDLYSDLYCNILYPSDVMFKRCTCQDHSLYPHLISELTIPAPPHSHTK